MAGTTNTPGSLCDHVRRGRISHFVTWLGDRLPNPLGSWLLRVSDDSEEPWVDAEGRLKHG